MESYTNVIATLRGWDELERSGLYSNAPDIVDFDLCPVAGSASFSSRRDVLEALDELWAEYSSDQDTHPIVRQDLGASRSFLRALLGDRRPFPEYLRSLLGFEPRSISDATLAATLASIHVLAERLGLEYSRAGMRRYTDRYRVPADEVPGMIRASQERWLDRLREFVPWTEMLDIRTCVVEFDEPWSFGLSGNLSEGITLEINSHQRHTFTEGQCDYIPSHEVAGHAVQFSCWYQAVVDERVPAVLGLISIHHPTIVLSEGISQALPYFLFTEDEIPLSTLFAKRLREYRDMVLANAQLRLLSGAPLDTVWGQCMSTLHHVEPLEVERELAQRSLDPLQQSYQFCYAPSFVRYRRERDRLASSDVAAFLRTQYDSIPDPAAFWAVDHEREPREGTYAGRD